MPQLRVLVVGASIAGPTTAYWFAKAGAKVTVIERYPELRTNGQNVDIRSVGVTVMRRIQGMEAAVRAKVVPIDGFSFVRENGKPFAVFKPTGNPDQQSLVSEYEIFRGDLSQILVDLTSHNENVRYVFGEQVTAIQQNDEEDGPVTVEFANGFPKSEYDLVVACDGATSRTRAIGLSCGVRDHMKSVNAWAGYFSTQKDILNGSKMGVAYSATGRFIGIGRDPVGVNRVIFMGILPPGQQDATRPFRDAASRGDASLKEYVAKVYSGAGWKCDEAVEHMMAADDFYATEIAQVKTPTLYKGRFVMVGDAGYAAGPTGGGTSLALAGAYALAGEIHKHKGDLSAGLKAYEETMRPLITDLQKIPPFVPNVMGPQTEWGLWFRNLILGLISSSGALEFAQKYLATAFASADKLKIPEYDWDN